MWSGLVRYNYLTPWQLVKDVSNDFSARVCMMNTRKLTATNHQYTIETHPTLQVCHLMSLLYKKLQSGTHTHQTTFQGRLYKLKRDDQEFAMCLNRNKRQTYSRTIKWVLNVELNHETLILGLDETSNLGIDEHDSWHNKNTKHLSPLQTMEITTIYSSNSFWLLALMWRGR